MFRKCDNCGANLDPGEKCGCNKEAECLQKFFIENTRVGEDSQMEFDFKKEIIAKQEDFNNENNSIKKDCD